MVLQKLSSKFSPCGPPSCCRALTNRRCNSGDQHRLCFRAFWYCGCGGPACKIGLLLGVEEETGLIPLVLETKPLELTFPLGFLIPRESPATDNPPLSSFLKHSSNDINALEPVLFLHPYSPPNYHKKGLKF